MKPNQIPIVLAALLLAANPHRLAAAETNFFRPLAFEQALKQAAEQKKIVFVDFYTTWCAPCKKLDQTTWQDPAVISLMNDKTIALKIDAEKETNLATRFKVEAYPTLLLVKPDGTVLDRLVGYREAPVFISEFNDALAGKTALVRARESVAAASTGDASEQARGRYDLAKALAREGKDEEALKEYLGLFDEGVKRYPSFAGVRTSFLLSSIVELGRQYPPALAALRERRDSLKVKLVAGDGDRSAAMDYAALNNALHELPLTLGTYDALPAGSPGRASLRPHVFEQLLQARRYAEAVEAQTAAEFTLRFGQLTGMLQGPNAPKVDDETRKVMLRINLEQAGKETEALAGAGKTNEARELAKRVLALEDSEPVRAMLRGHLERAGQPKLLD